MENRPKRSRGHHTFLLLFDVGWLTLFTYVFLSEAGQTFVTERHTWGRFARPVAADPAIGIALLIPHAVYFVFLWLIAQPIVPESLSWIQGRSATSELAARGRAFRFRLFGEVLVFQSGGIEVVQLGSLTVAEVLTCLLLHVVPLTIVPPFQTPVPSLAYTLVFLFSLSLLPLAMARVLFCYAHYIVRVRREGGE